MRLVVFGATGRIGRLIVKEALARGHAVTAAARDPARLDMAHDRLDRAAADATRAEDVARAAAGHDAVVSAVGPTEGDAVAIVVDAARALVSGARQAGVKRLVVGGGAGSLYVTPGVQLVDTPDFPAAWKPVALAHREALAIYREATDLEWTNVSPAALTEPGERTGRFRVGTDDLLVDKDGKSRISMEDFAIAIVDELERGLHKRLRITAAY